MLRKNDGHSWIPAPIAAPVPPPTARATPRPARPPSHWDLVSAGRVPATGWLARLVERR